MTLVLRFTLWGLWFAVTAPAMAQQMQVHLSQSAQAAAGIETRTLTATHRRPGFAALAEVTALGPLLEQRAAVLTARAARKAAQAQVAASSDSFKRLQALHADNGNISTRVLAEARAAHRVDVAHLAGAQARLETRLLKLSQTWGQALAGWALGAAAQSQWPALLERSQVLLLLTLPAGRVLAAGVDQVRVVAPGGAGRGAQVIGPAPGGSDLGPGPTWWLRTAAHGLRSGMRLQARVPAAAAPQNGVVLPMAAIVWRAGRPWAYVLTAPETFERRPVVGEPTAAGGWFVTRGFAAGDALVITGAQTLLGQELRGLIPEEDDD